MSSVPEGKFNLSKEACHSFFLSMYTSDLTNMYIYIGLLSTRAICGSAEQPLLGPNEKALNQPKPHP